MGFFDYNGNELSPRPAKKPPKAKRKKKPTVKRTKSPPQRPNGKPHIYLAVDNTKPERAGMG